jgi:transcriptional regulator with XRE-family HTH domain
VDETVQMEVSMPILRLRMLREARRLTRAKLAQRADINPATEGLIETGRFRPYPGQLVKLARALGLPAADAVTLLDVVPTDGAAPCEPGGSR